jgi:hypothetical protein
MACQEPQTPEMIEIAATAGRSLKMEQWCAGPTIYFDHWAWRKISESSLLANRFSNALNAREGTLTLSWLNLVEFSKVTDRRQTVKADALLDQILPRVFLLNPNFFKVIDVEDRLLAGGSPVPPHADFDTLKFFGVHNVSKRNSLKLFAKQNLFCLAEATQIQSEFDVFADSIVNHISSLQVAYAINPAFQLGVERTPEDKQIQRGTRFIAEELLRGFLVDQKINVDRHHAIDICHAVVPVAYCDYVLLDGHWENQVKRAEARISGRGRSIPMAKVFSEKKSGLERFLTELES